MGIIELPAWRLQAGASGRHALRSGVASSRPVMRVVKPLPGNEVVSAFCDRCAGPIEFGAVTKGAAVYCSVECSLEGPNRSA